MNQDERESIDSIIAELLAQRLEGKTPDIEAVLASHPDRAEEIRARLSDLEKLEGLWRQLSTGRSDGLVGEPVARGTSLGEFEVVREIGRGGMGVVYLARQKSLGRLVALKVISRTSVLSESTRNRFLRESEALASLAHPNVVPVFAAGEDKGTLYMAMGLVEGVSLADVLDSVRCCDPSEQANTAWHKTVQHGAATPAESVPDETGKHRQPVHLDKEYIRLVCRAMVAVARALHAAHGRGIVHRDVKPSNILLDSQGEAHLVDFGLASTETQPHVTMTGDFLGTPHYVAPEQVSGHPERVDRRADVYSLGATFYECLTLTTPFAGKSTPEILAQVVQGERQGMRRLNPSLPKDLEAVVAKAMELAPDARYATASDFADDLDRFLDGRPVQAKRAGLAMRAAKRIRRRPVHTALAALLVFCTAGGIALLLHWHAAAKHAEYERLMDEGEVLLHRATVAPRPMWLPDVIERFRGEALERFNQALSLRPQSFRARMQRARLRGESPTELSLAIEDAWTAAQSRPEARSTRLLGMYLETRHASEYAGAKDEVEAALEAAKGVDAEDAFFLGELAFAAGLRTTAFKHYSDCLAQQPNSYWAILHRTRVSGGGEQSPKDRILRDLTAARSLRPDLPFSYAQLATWHSIEGNHEEAQELLQKAIAIAPDDIMLHLALSDICAKIKDFDSALHAAEQAALLDDGGHALGRMAEVYRLRGEEERALSCYDQAIGRSRPDLPFDRPYLLRQKAQLLKSLGRNREALTCYEQALDLVPDDVHLHSVTGSLYHGMGESARALEHYERALALESKSIPTGYIGLLEQLDQRDKAADTLRKVIAAREACGDPEDFELVHHVMDLALLLWRGGRDTVSAKGVYEEFLSRHPDSVGVRFFYGQFLVLARLPDEAIEQLHKVLGMDPSRASDPGARFQLAEAYRLKGDLVRAAEEMRRCTHLDPANPSSRVRLAGLLRQLDQPAEAKKVCEEGLNLCGEEMRLRATLAAIAQDEGDMETALTEAEKAFGMALRCKNSTLEKEAAGVLDYYLGLLQEAGRPVSHILDACEAVARRCPYPLGQGLAFTKRAQVFSEQGRHADAEQAARAALKVIPAHCREERLWPSVWLASALQRQGKASEALGVYLQTARSNPWVTAAHSNAVVLMLDSPEHAEQGVLECTVWLEVLDEGARNTKTWEDVESKAAFLICRAMLLTRLRRTEEATADFQSALRLVPARMFCKSVHVTRLTQFLENVARVVKAETLRAACEEALDAARETQPAPASSVPRSGL